MHKTSTVIIGCDEVGLGPMVGPVVVAAVVLPRSKVISGVRDSKAMTDAERRRLAPIIKEEALYWVLAQSSAKQIDRYGVGTCKRFCMRACVLRCRERYPAAVVIVDGIDPIPGISNQKCVVKADTKIMAVSAASVIAKVHRDDFMIKLAQRYPRYGFEKHKGYVTRAHIRALKKHGPCIHHRFSYAPVKKVVEELGLLV